MTPRHASHSNLVTDSGPSASAPPTAPHWTGARDWIESSGSAIQVEGATMIGSDTTFDDRGHHELAGIDPLRQLYSVRLKRIGPTATNDHVGTDALSDAWRDLDGNLSELDRPGVR